VVAYIRPEDIRLIYPDRPLSRVVGTNHLDGIVAERRLGRHIHHLRVALPDGRQIEAVYPASSYASMNLTPGGRVRLALRKESIVIIAPHQSSSPIKDGIRPDGTNRTNDGSASDPVPDSLSLL
ncbi:MAG: TOBE domain-containing protein, partial [Roseiflexus sp.]